jgi:tetratricopeptide (TPR) repeat protein
MKTLLDELKCVARLVNNKHSATAIEEGIAITSSPEFDNLNSRFRACTYILISKAYHQIELIDKALHYTSLAVKANQENTFAYDLHQIGNDNSRTLEEIIKTIHVSITTNSIQIEAKKDLAIHYFNLGKVDLAIATIDEAIGEDPNNIHLKIDRCILLYGEEKEDKLIECFNQILQADTSVETFRLIMSIKSNLGLL